MAEKLSIDHYGRSLVSEQLVCKRLYAEPKLNYDKIQLELPEKYNQAIDSLYVHYTKLSKLESLDISTADYHERNLKIWQMPEEYLNLDIAKWLLEQCVNEVELQRTGQELLLFVERDMLNLLRYLKYLVDTMRFNNIVWGVGRGSSVASFVLYLIGVHRINSIVYNLDIEEFIR
jgi:DNA polymerase III alpha subunit